MSEPVALSVVLPVHRGVHAEHFRACLDSIYGQTHAAQEVIVVEDGPLECAHHEVLDSFAGKFPVMRRVRLRRNQGAGVANQAGLLNSRCEWVAKMDADDIALPNRFEVQVRVLCRTDCDVLGAAMAEFVDHEHDIDAIRQQPSRHNDIARLMRRNNPLNHSTVIFRRDLAVKVGGYPSMRFMQDYDLFARMLVAGARMSNLPEPLVLFRADAGMYRRRRSRLMTQCEFELQRNLRAYGIVSPVGQAFNLVFRLAARRLPAPLLRSLYWMVGLRRRADFVVSSGPSVR